MDGDLKSVVVFVEQAFDLDEVFLLKGAEGILDVVPHLGFELTGTVAKCQSQVRLAGFLGLDLLGNHHKAGNDGLDSRAARSRR